jgi:hypothetical protein
MKNITKIFTKINLLLIGGFLVCLNIQAQTNLITNGDFAISDDQDPGFAWDFNVNNNRAGATFSVVNAKGEIVITEAGSAAAQIRLRQDIAFIAGNNYTVTFDYTGTETTLGDAIRYFHIYSDNSTRAIGQYQDVTAGVQSTYSFTWTQSITETISINIQTGKNSGTVTIDNVVLIDNGVLSIDDAKLELINLYPNPVSDKLRVEFSKIDKNREIIIFDSRGQMIHKESASVRHKQIDIASLNTKGVLFVKIISGNQYKVYKIIAL